MSVFYSLVYKQKAHCSYPKRTVTFPNSIKQLERVYVIPVLKYCVVWSFFQFFNYVIYSKLKPNGKDVNLWCGDVTNILYYKHSYLFNYSTKIIKIFIQTKILIGQILIYHYIKETEPIRSVVHCVTLLALV